MPADHRNVCGSSVDAAELLCAWPSSLNNPLIVHLLYLAGPSRERFGINRAVSRTLEIPTVLVFGKTKSLGVLKCEWLSTDLWCNEMGKTLKVEWGRPLEKCV